MIFYLLTFAFELIRQLEVTLPATSFLNRCKGLTENVLQSVGWFSVMMF